MRSKSYISEEARRLFDCMPEICWMTTENLAKTIGVRKSKISNLLDELEEARLIDIHFFENGKRRNPKRQITKVKRNTSKPYNSLLNAIYIGFPPLPLDRNSIIEVYLNSRLPIVPFEALGKQPTMSMKAWTGLNRELQLNHFLNNPQLNVALRVPKILTVIDVDINLLDRPYLSNFDKTLTVSTARGFHFYFQRDAVVNKTTSGVLPNIDTKNRGSFVLIPPSIHSSGTKYEWSNFAKIEKLPIEFRREWRKAYFSKTKLRGELESKSIIPKGTRNDYLWRYGRHLKGQGKDLYEIEEALQTVNSERCVPKLPSFELARLIEHIWAHPSST